MTTSFSAFALFAGKTEAQAPAARVTMRAKLTSSMVDEGMGRRWKDEPHNGPPFYRVPWCIQLRTERLPLSSLCYEGGRTPRSRQFPMLSLRQEHQANAGLGARSSAQRGV